jgi:hypothetical protein
LSATPVVINGEITRLHPLVAPWIKESPVEAMTVVRATEYERAGSILSLAPAEGEPNELDSLVYPET